jgi:hypothetical protein
LATTIGRVGALHHHVNLGKLSTKMSDIAKNDRKDATNMGAQTDQKMNYATSINGARLKVTGTAPYFR